MWPEVQYFKRDSITTPVILLTYVHNFFIIYCKDMLQVSLKRFMVVNVRPSMRRRLTFASLVLLNQILLIALAIAWIVHMAIIALNGSVFFKETNPVILWMEISTMVLIALLAIYVLAIQVRRLGERRRGTDSRD